MKPHRQSERGAALLSVLVLVAILSVASLMAVTVLTRQVESAKAVQARAQAVWAAYSAEAVASGALSELAGQGAGATTAFLKQQGITPLTVPISAGLVEMTVTDGGNCFNINELASSQSGGDSPQSRAWARLLEDIGLGGNEALRLTATLADWVDADHEPRPGGAEDSLYLNRSPAYRAASQPMLSPRELASVDGYTPALRQALRPYVCTFRPGVQPRLNVNTLQPSQALLLRALYSEALPATAAERILANRPEGGWASIEAFEAQPDIARIPPGARNSALLTLITQAVHVRGVTYLATGSWPFEFVMTVSDNAVPTTVWRRLGEE